jgi:ubiquinone/menaquinone biosynthesis C-methylase UbiE
MILISMERKKLEKETRGIFHKLHIEQKKDNAIFARLVSLLDEEYLKEKKGFFKNRICLDAGCGSNANASYAMLRMGAKKVYCFDLDESILKTVPEILGEFKGRFVVSADNILQMKYADNFFDFVHCSGVLHHSADMFKGLNELARVTRKGGILYVGINGKSGLMRDITNMLREKYRNDSSFKDIIDNLSPGFFESMFGFIFQVMREKDDGYAGKISIDEIKRLFNNDLVLTIKDRIQAPTYTEISEGDLVGWFKKNGFSKIVRLSRYPRYENIRRYLSPLYYKYDSKYSKLLYGDGFIQLKATKN